MSSRSQSVEETRAAADARNALRLTRSINATWWYTAAAILLFEVTTAFLTWATLFEVGYSAVALAVVGFGGLLWTVATLPLLLDYRHRTDATPLLVWRRHLASLLIAAACGIAAGLVTGIWMLGVLPPVQMLMLLNWPPGVRLRVVLTATALLVTLAVVDVRLTLGVDPEANWFPLVFFATLLPIITVTSLWWWDVLIRLDRARAAEAKLAATQERLRVATDVHDLQGHHLQVIALQLELAERLMPQDAEAGMEQLRAARSSVDDARQGTRDLAMRFRSVPLRDELANAVDLLRAAGTKAEATVHPDSALAPASVLGPVIRETTTNVLRHGGGRWARLQLTVAGGSWRYEISNDTAADLPPAPDGRRTDGSGTDGSGLEGIGRRAEEGGGTLEVLRTDDTFTVVVTVPARGVEAR